MATLRGRVGVAAGPALFFATGGAAFGEWDVYMRMAGGPDAAVFSNSSVQTGWVAGGGVEYAFSERFSLKGEYLYADFGSVKGQSAFFPTAPAFVNQHSIDLTAQVARAGINYRF
jgi:outer membrane immunogenic protein